MDVVRPTPESPPPAAREKGLVEQVFEVLGDRLADRAGDIAVFCEAASSFEAWCVWEAAAAFNAMGRGWVSTPNPPYTDLGVTGSREHADLLVDDPISGQRVLIELSVIHDWTRNKWIDDLDGDTTKLSRNLAPGITPLQLVIAASHDAHIDVNPRRQQWLGMTTIWKRPTALHRVLPLGRTGQLGLHGWVLAPHA